MESMDMAYGFDLELSHWSIVLRTVLLSTNVILFRFAIIHAAAAAQPNNRTSPLAPLINGISLLRLTNGEWLMMVSAIACAVSAQLIYSMYGIKWSHWIAVILAAAFVQPNKPSPLAPLYTGISGLTNGEWLMMVFVAVSAVASHLIYYLYNVRWSHWKPVSFEVQDGILGLTNKTQHVFERGAELFEQEQPMRVLLSTSAGANKEADQRLLVGLNGQHVLYLLFAALMSLAIMKTLYGRVDAQNWALSLGLQTRPAKRERLTIAAAFEKAKRQRDETWSLKMDGWKSLKTQSQPSAELELDSNTEQSPASSPTPLSPSTSQSNIIETSSASSPTPSSPSSPSRHKANRRVSWSFTAEVSDGKQHVIFFESKKKPCRRTSQRSMHAQDFKHLVEHAGQQQQPAEQLFDVDILRLEDEALYGHPSNYYYTAD